MTKTDTGALTLLSGPQAADVLGAALGEYDAELLDLALADVRVQPAGAVRARYVADVRRADGGRGREALVAVGGSTIPAGAAVVAGEYRGEPIDVGVWRWPQDPALPALQVAEDPTMVAALLADLGLPISARPRLAVRAYRPAQRAVLQVDDGTHCYFLKAVRPAAVADLCVRHRLLAGRLPVPPVLGHRADGIVVLPEAPGVMVRESLTGTGDFGSAPTPGDLEELLDALPDELLELAPQRSVLQRVEGSAQVLRICATADPELPVAFAAELIDAADRIVDGVLSQTVPEPTVPAHGDFYHAQLLARHGEITALLDVDTAGPGERVDEWATLIGHLSVLGIGHPGAREYCAIAFEHARRRVEPTGLCHRIAAVVLGLSTGPFRNRLPDWHIHTAQRLELAQRWLMRPMRDRSSAAPGVLTL
ncbi:hypothetical protein JDV09_11150 [Mycobacterium sp. Y57]|uniref:hypothetical protein n=1 Tax=Mycolicibacterium xanthum TaxID=2796469 RepID=UPI001C85B9CE|nr:hypothetical protein [Mycolicibacterium xanthum]MBX7432656.1 hypothetical protein [Mycolicibacterium xanthum]